MKRIVIIAVAVLLALSAGTQAFAKSEQMGNAEVDASLVWASAPASGFDSTIGLCIGGGTMVDKDIQARVDITFLTWSESFYGVDLDYSRTPVTVSGRYYIPMDQNDLKVFVQGGLELSFDKVEVGNFFFPGEKTSESDVRLGITPGAGIDLAIAPQLSIVADLRWHIITDSYFTLQAGVAYHF
jgi:opacity protein-like surface antigen